MKTVDKFASKWSFLKLGSMYIPAKDFEPDANSGDVPLKGEVTGKFRSDIPLVDESGFDLGAYLASGECVANLCLNYSSSPVDFYGDVKVTDYRVTSVVGEVANYYCRVESVKKPEAHNE